MTTEQITEFTTQKEKFATGLALYESKAIYGLNPCDLRDEIRKGYAIIVSLQNQQTGTGVLTSVSIDCLLAALNTITKDLNGYALGTNNILISGSDIILFDTTINSIWQ